MDIYNNKMTVWVYFPIQESSVTNYTDLLTYSYLAYQDKLNKTTKTSRIAWATGLSSEGVQGALERLSLVGLVIDGKAKYLPEFREMQSDGTHWSQRFTYWKCLVRSDNSDLTVTDCMVFSYLHTKICQNFTPRNGWSAAYLGKVLTIDRKTISASLIRLEEMFLFSSDNWKIASELNEEQHTFFKVASGNVKKGGFFTPPAITDWELRQNEIIAKHIMTRPEFRSKETGLPIRKKALPYCLGSNGRLLADWKTIVNKIMDNPEDYQILAGGES